MDEQNKCQSKNKLRILTAGSLFDGHDVAINIMRRIMQRSGAEVIHLGHNRSVQEIVDAAIQEDVHAIAITSYQGGHMEFFKYTYDLLNEKGAGHIRIFGGGGGTILPEEIDELHEYGISRIYSPDDGRNMGLQGMIDDLLLKSDFCLKRKMDVQINKEHLSDFKIISQAITAAEDGSDENAGWLRNSLKKAKSLNTPILGVSGTGGAGKSSLVDELVLRFNQSFPGRYLAIVSVDPTKKISGGALLGDRIRMNAINDPHLFMRSLATRSANKSLSASMDSVLGILKLAGFDLIILESSGIGQSDSEITNYVSSSLYVMTPEFGAASQLEKIEMLDFADFVAINKFDKNGAQDALRDVRKQYQRSRDLWDTELNLLPVFPTIASQFNDPGINALFSAIMNRLFSGLKPVKEFNRSITKAVIIPPARVRYLSEISETVRNYNRKFEEQAVVADKLFALQTIQAEVKSKDTLAELDQKREEWSELLLPENKMRIENWDSIKSKYRKEEYSYTVRGREIRIPNFTKTLSHNKIPKVAMPGFSNWGDLIRWFSQENLPGEFPFTAGVFPFKREGEDPTRMFAGEGEPERTNRRFHYVSKGLPAKRLSTAFDSVTLYGFDPDMRPDIYGKVGNSGVSVCSLNDAKKLYSGFDLCDPSCSVSMTINGPAAIICAFFMNAAIDQQCEKYIRKHGLEYLVEDKLKENYDDKGLSRPIYAGQLPEGNEGLGLLLLGLSGDQILDEEVYNKLKEKALQSVRGTVQADILKEDQAQNTCIFSTEFSLKLMGDVQEYFVKNKVQNFYSVSISGYHIAEAGANPISQLAFTLANGFTFVEYYLARGLHIDEFAPNLSFFFSNGLDPEYAVIGRVARRIWAKAMKYKYGANERSQKLKYHIQTSGRSLHAQEISFNDIRTTLQALYAVYDNCNSLHTNAYDEAITTPTEESVRRALAIQLIINKELGMTKNENPLQGSFLIEELTDLVEEAVLAEFDRLTERGGVLGAMETMYQRSKIQEESMHYESLKHSGRMPIIGVNSFLSEEGSPTLVPREVIRATTEEKDRQISNLENLKKCTPELVDQDLKRLQEAVYREENIFEILMEIGKRCSLGQITRALFDVGGKYRRSM